MSQDLWTRIDTYFAERLIGKTPVLESVLGESEAAGLPPMTVSPALGQFLALQIRALGARRVLEIGTLAGYSTIWMARALKATRQGNAYLLTLEHQAEQVDLARKNLSRAGVQDIVEVRHGDARKTLPTLVNSQTEPFDFIFLDADKVNYPTYFEQCLALSRPGTVMIVDNVVLHGAVTENEYLPAAQGIRQLTDLVAQGPQVEATVLQTVGEKGHDGIMMIVVKGEGV